MARKTRKARRRGSQQGAAEAAAAVEPFAPSLGKPVRASQVEYVEVVLPSQANPLGNVLGGHVMHLIDITAAIAAHRHSNSYAATVAVDYLDFRHPIKIGQLIVLKASVNRVFQTSMEVGVKVFSEDILTGERRHTSSAYVTFVALDEKGNPKPVLPVICETPEERRRYGEAESRRQQRLAHRYKRTSG
ncbi:MAG: acyl-CoA thioesterase [Acidobacteria bacterium]|nr:acyl-CoA thioesterase [Acidobacteriota bacterium]